MTKPHSQRQFLRYMTRSLGGSAALAKWAWRGRGEGGKLNYRWPWRTLSACPCPRSCPSLGHPHNPKKRQFGFFQMRPLHATSHVRNGTCFCKMIPAALTMPANTPAAIPIATLALMGMATQSHAAAGAKVDWGQQLSTARRILCADTPEKNAPFIIEGFSSHLAAMRVCGSVP